MLIPPPPCAETSLSPSPPRKPTIVYAASHTNQLAHTRLAHAHPYIRRHRSTDLHRCISARAKLSAPSIRVRLATQSRRRADCASSALALTHRGRHKRRGRRAHRTKAPASAPWPLRAHTHKSRSQRLYARLQFPAPRHTCDTGTYARFSPGEWIPCHQRARIPTAHTACRASTPHRNLPRTQENQAGQGAARTRTFAAPAPAPAADGAVVAGLN
ncbi:hypothetical protein B0H13DRAFT_2437526 [Mycena leptocephala]|nr:hypothetical protein B0H13DRAFT_2437526 [Mycena leptocephala]